MVPSKPTEYYDDVPEMSAPEVADSLITALKSNRFGFLAANFANPDMVGHTGNLKAAIKAVEAVDHQLGRVIKNAQDMGYTTIVTADHGNAEQMIDTATGKPFTAHTNNKVPFILLLDNGLAEEYSAGVSLRENGLLGNIAPTILELMDIPKPEAMSCSSLIRR
jgi:2,3-bisphosphoglycerate-independent phosphoglycerate mutase